MYCVQCGVKLVDTEAQCPLCQTQVYHPAIRREESEPLYPIGKFPIANKRSLWPQALTTVALVLPMLIVLLCDLQFSPRVTWSGYVIGALLVGYVIALLPTWFKKPNSVIFTPCGFAAVGLYLLYINVVTDGGWFLTFAFPVVGGLGLIVTTVVTLLRYVRGGKLYILGSASIALGGLSLLIEFLLTVTFPTITFVGWSLYPLTVLVLLGGFLLFLGICRPARETMQRKFFI